MLFSCPDSHKLQFQLDLFFSFLYFSSLTPARLGTMKSSICVLWLGTTTELNWTAANKFMTLINSKQTKQPTYIHIYKQRYVCIRTYTIKSIGETEIGNVKFDKPIHLHLNIAAAPGGTLAVRRVKQKQKQKQNNSITF